MFSAEPGQAAPLDHMIQCNIGDGYQIKRAR